MSRPIVGENQEAYKGHIRVTDAHWPREGVDMSGYRDLCLVRADQGQAVRALLDRVADKWSLLVVATLDEGRQRFTTIQRLVPGISQRMLTLTLRHLERDGLVTRSVHAEVPPRVEYELTPLAGTLIPHAVALAGWAVDHRATIEANRSAYDART